MDTVHTKKHQKAADLRKHCARGGTRTGFQPLNFRRSPANIANPGQSGTSTTQSEAQGVHIVRTLFLAHFAAPTRCLSTRLGEAVVSWARFRSDKKSRPPEPDRPQMSTVQRGGPHAGNQRTSWQRVPPFRTSHREKNSKLHDQPTGRPSAKRARTTNGAVALQTSDGKLPLVQQPAGDWTALADTELLRLSGTTIHDGAQVLAGAAGTVQRIDVNFTPGSAEEFGLILRGDRVNGTR